MVQIVESSWETMRMGESSKDHLRRRLFSFVVLSYLKEALIVVLSIHHTRLYPPDVVVPASENLSSRR